MTKRYEDLVALDNVSLKIDSSEVFGLLGPNGAGKSTLLKTIVGILRPTSGTIRVGGNDIVQNPESAKRIIGYLPENPSLYTGLTTQEFLQFVGKIRGVDDDRLDQEISESLKSFSLEEKRDSLIGSLSKGMKQKVAIIATSLHSPEVLVLDEPLTALDPRTRVSVKEWIASQTKTGVTTILSTHDLDVAQTHSGRIAIIDRGKIIAVGGIESLRKMANAETDARLEDVFLRLTTEAEETGKNLSWPGSWGTILVLARYWIKGRFTRAALVGLLVGEAFSIFFILFAGGTFLSFSNRIGLRSGFSEVAWSIFLGFYIIGLIQSGFNGSGLPVSGSDVDYVFTSPVPPRDVFAAKVLLNSITTVLVGFPPIFVLYLRFASYYHTPWPTAAIAGLVTLVFLVMGLFLSADITLSLGSSIGKRRKLWRNLFIVLVLALSLLPITLLIPGVPTGIADVAQILPNGLTATLSVGLVSGTPGTLSYLLDLLLLFAWLGGFLLLGVRMSRGHFYELLEVRAPSLDRGFAGRKNEVSRLNVRGKSIWSVIRLKERIMINRTRESRALFINALFLSGFLVIYALSGAFQSSPVSFLFILFIIGSFGSGNASRWIEKERLWILKTSPVSMRRYVKEVYRARVALLLLYITPITVAVGVPLVLSQLGQPLLLLGVVLALPAALQIAALTMGGGMYFASKWGQSTSDDILSSQAQELTDIKRFLFQTTISLILFSPLMVLVLASQGLAAYFGPSSLPPMLASLPAISLAYTAFLLNVLLNKAGDSILKREDL